MELLRFHIAGKRCHKDSKRLQRTVGGGDGRPEEIDDHAKGFLARTTGASAAGRKPASSAYYCTIEQKIQKPRI